MTAASSGRLMPSVGSSWRSSPSPGTNLIRSSLSFSARRSSNDVFSAVGTPTNPNDTPTDGVRRTVSPGSGDDRHREPERQRQARARRAARLRQSPRLLEEGAARGLDAGVDAFADRLVELEAAVPGDEEPSRLHRVRRGHHRERQLPRRPHVALLLARMDQQAHRLPRQHLGVRHGVARARLRHASRRLPPRHERQAAVVGDGAQRDADAGQHQLRREDHRRAVDRPRVVILDDADRQLAQQPEREAQRARRHADEPRQPWRRRDLLPQLGVGADRATATTALPSGSTAPARAS